LAIFFHMLLNASALLVLPRWGVYVTEALLLGLGLLALLGVRRLRPLFPAPEAIYASSARVIDQPRVRDEGRDEERLDESRFL
jgi:hypothetical protein